jgi:hypothetical protein
MQVKEARLVLTSLRAPRTQQKISKPRAQSLPTNGAGHLENGSIGQPINIDVFL